jgi:endo-1,4-beta-xylanase
MKRCSAVLTAIILALAFVMPPNFANAELSGSKKFLGNIISNNVPSNYANYWNQVTPENASKWESVEASRDNMNWSGVDTCYKYAKSKNYPFKFHTLVWGSQQPGWIDSISAAAQKEEVLEWIQAAGSKYGSSDYVDVVNEPLHAKPSFRNAIGGDGKTGWDWIIWSFEQARKYFSGKLLINEYGIINDTNATNKYIAIINLLKDRNLIDGIGIQCHQFNMNYVSVNTMKTNLDKLAATGLPIYVSELDIDGNDSNQLSLYKEKFPVLWEHPAVEGITLWGYIEGQTWKNNTHLVTAQGVERPALKWLKTYLDSEIPTPTSAVPTPMLTITPTPSITAVPTQSPEGALVLDTDLNAWKEGYTISMTLKNNSISNVSGWKLIVNKSDFNISSIWCAQVKESEDKLIITPVSWNSTIVPGGTVSFGFQCIGTPVKGFSYTIK